LKKEGNRKSPFVKGDLEGFSTARHGFDETLRQQNGEREKRRTQRMASLCQDWLERSLTLKLSPENRIVYAVDRLKGGLYILELTV
jgi:ribonuclease PH